MQNFPRCALLLMVMLCALAAPLFAQPAHVRVVSESAAPGGNGQTWATAYTHPQEALDEAATDPTITEIWVAAGEYIPTRRVDPGDPKSATFLLQSGLSIYGGFAGHETSLAERDIAANPTVLTGAGNWPERSYHIVRAEGTDLSARIDGFTIQRGEADSYKTAAARAFGAGAHLASAATIANCTFRENMAFGGGGGVWVNASSHFEKCVFEANIHGGNPGTAVYVAGGSPLFIGCTFRQRAGTPEIAIFNVDENATYEECVLEDALGSGDGLIASGGTFIRCIFRNNQPRLLSDAVLIDSDILENSNVYSLINQTHVFRSRIVENDAPLAWRSSFINTLITGNRGTFGSIFSESSLVQCTIFDNEVILPSSHVFWRGAISNSILVGTTWKGPPYSSFFYETDVRNSLLDPGLPQVGTNGNFSADPRFADTHGRLAPTSPAIDAGNNTLVPAGITTDLDGNPRFHDDPGMPNRGTPGGHGGSAIIDLGAYEFQGESCYANCDNSITPPILNIDDFTCFINRFANGDPYANCDGSSIEPLLNVDDFTCFINQFATGCP